MENASKALIMAGAVLIALIIISLGVMVFRNMSSSVTKNSELSQEQIASFNSKITPYIGENISGSQVNNLIQYARTNNKKFSNEDDGRIITITGIGSVAQDGSSSTPVPIGVYYIVSGEYDSNGLITTIEISQSQ